MGVLSYLKRTFGRGEEPAELEIVDNSIDKSLFVAEDDDALTVDSRPETVVTSKSTLIDEIFAYLNMDFESKGYADAIVQPDSHYLNENLELLVRDYQLKIDQARHKFQEFLTELNFHITTREAMGLTEVVEGLKAKKTIVTEHLNFVEQERQDIAANRGKIERIKLSYTKGFKRGASALSNSFITSSNI
jgi:hypothetical protein